MGTMGVTVRQGLISGIGARGGLVQRPGRPFDVRLFGGGRIAGRHGSVAV